MKYFKVSDLIFYIPLTLLLVYDFFPNSSLSNIIPRELNIWIILALFLISIFSKRFQKVDNKEAINNQIFSIAYLIFVILVLTILGGSSTSGIGFNNIGIWLALAISFGEIYSQKRKLNSQNNNDHI